MRIVIDNIVNNNERIGLLIDRLLNETNKLQSEHDIITIMYEPTKKVDKNRIDTISNTYEQDLYLAIKLNYFRDLPLEHSAMYFSRSADDISEKLIKSLNYNIPEQKHYNMINKYSKTMNVPLRKTILFMPGFENNQAYIDKFENTNYLYRLAESIIGGF
ncbi:MAG: hypothetical protein WC549_02095 [Actinomycetota bacterium]